MHNAATVLSNERAVSAFMPKEKHMVLKLLFLLMFMTGLIWLVWHTISDNVSRKAIKVPLLFVVLGAIAAALYFDMEKIIQ